MLLSTIIYVIFQKATIYLHDISCVHTNVLNWWQLKIDRLNKVFGKKWEPAWKTDVIEPFFGFIWYHLAWTIEWFILPSSISWMRRFDIFQKVTIYLYNISYGLTNVLKRWQLKTWISAFYTELWFLWLKQTKEIKDLASSSI